MWMWLTESRFWSTAAGTPLPVCCLSRFAPQSVFSVRGKTFSITREGTWMVALLVWWGLLVPLPLTTIAASNQNPPPQSSPTMLFSSVHPAKQNLLDWKIFILFTSQSLVFWSQEVGGTRQGSKRFDPWGRVRAGARSASSTMDAQRS